MEEIGIRNIYEELKDTLSVSQRDAKTVLQAIDERIIWYGKKMTNPKYASKAPIMQKALRDLKNQIAANPNIIKQHADAYAEIARQERLKQEKEIRELGNPLVNNGLIEQSSLTQLANKTKLSEAEVLRILGASVKPPKNFKYKDDGVKELSKVEMDKIAVNLKILGKRDLYEFLDVPPSAPLNVIKAQRDLKFKSVSGNSNKTDPKVNATDALVKSCNIFDKPDGRRSYDKTLENAGFESIKDAIKMLKLITPAQYSNFLDSCVKKGINKDKAEYLIYAAAKESGIVIDEGVVDKSITCRFCSALNNNKSQNCHICGMPLKVVCPNCGQKSADNDNKCTKCGFSIIGMKNADVHLAMARAALRIDNLDDARKELKSASVYWPNCPKISVIENEIIEKLKLIPLLPPTLLSAKVLGKIIRLTWQPSKSENVSYQIIRKANALPSNIKDGEYLGLATNTTFDDNTAEAGVSYFYAVYSKSDNRVSSNSASLSTPVMRIEDIDARAINVTPNDTSLAFVINLPHGVHSIEIFRDGKLVKTLTGTSFLDSGLISRKTYNYKFVSVFRDSLGCVRKSNGLDLQFTPMPKPTAVDLEMTEDDKQAVIKWKTPTIGTLYIYQSDKIFDYNRNDAIAMDVFSANRLSIIGNSYTIKKNFSGERYFLPVTVQGNIGVAGKMARIVSISSLSNVQIDRIDNSVEVSWSWTNVSAVRILYSFDGNSTQRKDVNNAQDNCIKIPIAQSPKSIMVKIMPLVISDGKEQLGSPIEKTFNLKDAKISFEEAFNVKKGLFFATDEYTVSIRCDTYLPCDLYLLVGEQYPPMDLVNCEPHLVIISSEIKPNVLLTKTFSYVRKKKGQSIHFRLITSDRRFAKHVTITPETREIK